ncbi:BRISC and BRCA1-A complex member 2-like isoform X2 [Dreissena polymorpha]|uniref:BRISC and BRCA1-A complex member 2-like isoform X2 n=1 Tax=Dreissena polymorpha TaxID=45954 RepID=UPI002263FAB3|nr:BRISC and BRCA1-A complex member 2-like isoform X2 [Dreissena polymorpha]
MLEENIIYSLFPKLSHLILNCMHECEVGICAGRIKLTELTYGCPTVLADNQGKCDRFKVVIPYAGQTLTWEVIFDANCPKEPPDFIFDADGFLPDMQYLPSLNQWDYMDPGSLSRVLVELLAQYKTYQEQLIFASERLSFEYKALIKDTEITSHDVEIYSTRTENRVGPINFLIKLPVDFSRIPAYILKVDPGEDAALLLVTFNNPEGTRITPQLYLSPRVENGLGGSSQLRIPGFPDRSCLTEYVQEVNSLLTNKVEQIVQCYEKRRDYMSALLAHFGRSVLEYDAEGFYKVSFLFEWNDFFFMIYIELLPVFPKEQPVVTFQSIYHELKGRPYSESHQTDYPFSPRWTGQEMADRARQFILENIGAFQKTSVRLCAT